MNLISQKFIILQAEALSLTSKGQGYPLYTNLDGLERKMLWNVSKLNLAPTVCIKTLEIL